ncbi:MAG: dephospho-CoA kinase [Gaiellales bacterium]
MRRPVRVVGLTGGIGAGKSEALRAFAEHGASTLSSDAVVHELYRDPGVREAVLDRYGAEVMDVDGEIDRSAIAARVFADAAERRWLEQLLLPLISERFFEWRDRELAAGSRLLVHEAPTLFEAGVEDRYDAIVAITAPDALREQRRPGAAERMRHQLPEQEKAERSDFVFTNDGDLAALDRWVAELVEKLEAA